MVLFIQNFAHRPAEETVFTLIPITHLFISVPLRAAEVTVFTLQPPLSCSKDVSLLAP